MQGEETSIGTYAPKCSSHFSKVPGLKRGRAAGRGRPWRRQPGSALQSRLPAPRARRSPAARLTQARGAWRHEARLPCEARATASALVSNPAACCVLWPHASCCRLPAVPSFSSSLALPCFSHCGLVTIRHQPQPTDLASNEKVSCWDALRDARKESRLNKALPFLTPDPGQQVGFRSREPHVQPRGVFPALSSGLPSLPHFLFPKSNMLFHPR